MPRDNDKNNDRSRGRRDRPSSGAGRSGKPRGPEKKFVKRGVAPAGRDGERPKFERDRTDSAPRRDDARPKFSRERDGEKRPYAAKSDGARSYGKKPYAGSAKPYAGKRDGDRPRRDDGDAPRRNYSDAPRPARFNRDDRPARSDGDRPSRGPRKDFGPREGGGEKRPYAPRSPRNDAGGERPAWKRDDRAPRGDRPDRGESKPWQKRDASSRDARSRDDVARSPRPPRDGAKRFDKPRSDRPGFDKPRYDKPRDDKPRYDKPRSERGGDDRPRFSRASDDRPQRAQGAERGPRNFDRPKFDRPKFDRPREGREDRPRGDRPQGDRPFRERPKFDRPREDRPRFDRPRESRNDWQEHPRSEARPAEGDHFSERPRRENEDDSRVFAKRPAFGGRGAYRERPRDEDKRAPRPERKPDKEGDRIAKVLSRAGLASRRDAETMVTEGRVAVNGRVINSPALDVTSRDVITVDGEKLPPRERTRLFLYHKPRGLMTTHDDPEGRPTVFDNLPEGLPRLISIGRLDYNTEGLLLLTNDGGLARALELPETGWLRRYRVRAHGEVSQAQLDLLRDGVEIDGVKYGSIDATLERDKGANVWLVFAIREGKNREVRNVMAHLGLEVNRLIRVSYGPFQLGETPEGQVEEIRTRVLREQLGDKIAKIAGAEFSPPTSSKQNEDKSESGKRVKPAGRSALIADRKGRRVLVQRSGSPEARERNEDESNGYGPPRRPKRGYHGKRDLTPREE